MFPRHLRDGEQSLDDGGGLLLRMNTFLKNPRHKIATWGKLTVAKLNNLCKERPRGKAAAAAAPRPVANANWA